MLFNSALTLALFAPSALAGFVIIVPTSTSVISNINAQQASSITAQYASAISSYEAQLTTQPAYGSAWDVIRDYESTGKERMPADVTATDKIVTYTTTPDWYAALPTDVKQYFESMGNKYDEIGASVVAKVMGGATRPTGMGVYVCGAVAAAVAGVAVAL